MIREFVDLVNEAVDTGYEKGINLFMENLERDLEKDSIIEEQQNGVDDVIRFMFINEGYEVEGMDDIVNEDVVDEALKELDDEIEE